MDNQIRHVQNLSIEGVQLPGCPIFDEGIEKRAMPFKTSLFSYCYLSVLKNATTCQVCSSVRMFFHGGMDVPGLPSEIRQNK